MLHVRRPAPMLIIPLASAAGRSFRCDEVEFTIQTVGNEHNSTNVAMSGRLNVAKADLSDHADAELIRSRLEVMGDHQIQLTDADGNVLADAFERRKQQRDPRRLPMVYGHFSKGQATHLRYYSMVRVRAEAAFDFQNVPLP